MQPTRRWPPAQPTRLGLAFAVRRYTSRRRVVGLMRPALPLLRQMPRLPEARPARATSRVIANWPARALRGAATGSGADLSSRTRNLTGGAPGMYLGVRFGATAMAGSGTGRQLGKRRHVGIAAVLHGGTSALLPAMLESSAYIPFASARETRAPVTARVLVGDVAAAGATMPGIAVTRRRTALARVVRTRLPGQSSCSASHGAE
jgi:hypothetical protein